MNSFNKISSYLPIKSLHAHVNKLLNRFKVLSTFNQLTKLSEWEIYLNDTSVTALSSAKKSNR